MSKTFIVTKVLEAHCQRWLLSVWGDTPDEFRQEFINDETDLIAYHHTIGREMRNQCGIWKYQKYLDEHADDFSHRMLVKFRGRINEQHLRLSNLPTILGL